MAQVRGLLQQLTLDNKGTVRVEQERIARDGDYHTPLFVKLPFNALCWVLDVIYENRPIQVQPIFSKNDTWRPRWWHGLKTQTCNKPAGGPC